MIVVIHTLSHVMYNNNNIQDFIKYGRRCRLWFLLAVGGLGGASGGHNDIVASKDGGSAMK